MSRTEAALAPHQRVRRAEDADLGAIAQIEAACFEQAWTRRDYLAELARKTSRLDLLYHGENEQVAAFILCWEILDEVHVLRMATRPSTRRRGHARCLLEHVIRESRSRGRRVAKLEVGSSNEPALLLYQSCGFNIVGRRKGYYQDGQDALLLDLQL